MDALGFCLSLLGIYGLLLYLRYLLPRYVIPPLSTLLNESQQLLRHAEVIGAISPESEYKAQLDRLMNDFAMMRVESNHARGACQQLWLAVRRGLACRLYALYYRIEAVKLTLELAIDKKRLDGTQTVTGTVVANPTTVSAVSVNNHVVQQTLPLPVTTS